MSLDFNVNYDNEKLKVKLTGYLDNDSAPELRIEIDKFMDKPISEMIFFCEGLEYFSSAGLAIFLQCAKKVRKNDKEGKIYIIGANDYIKKVLYDHGFNEFICLQNKYPDE